jgi:hypothetical protein
MDGILGRVMQIAVGLILIVGVVVAAQGMFASSKANNATSDLLALGQAIQGGYSAQPTFGTVTNTVAISAGWVPSDMGSAVTSPNITNQWGGAVTVAVDTNTSQFDVTETRVPNGACSTMLNGAQNAVSVTLNGSAIAGPPFDPGTIAASCNTGSNTLKFVFSH